MTYTIAGPCNKDTDCLDVCPVDAIHPRRDDAGFPRAARLRIDAETCIGCGSCFRVCSGGAVVAREEAAAPIPLAAHGGLIQLEAGPLHA